MPEPLTPSLSPQLKTFLEHKMRTGDPITIEVRKESFTGRVFRLMLQEGWIAMEHVDGRRRAFFVIEGGKITDGAVELPLASAAPAGHAAKPAP